MSRDLIIPILVPVLIANVVLVALATRAILRRPRGNGAGAPSARPRAAARPSAAVRLADIPPAIAPIHPPAPEPVEPVDLPASGPVGSGPSAPGAEQPAELPEPMHTRRRPRGRPSEPPMDDAHERILRSLLALPDPDADNGGATPGGRPGPPTTSSTIAVLGLAGYEALEEAAGARVAEGVASAVGETLRRAARGTDRVVALGDGRFCALLPATGERAAASYLRRVSVACDPWLGAAAAPVSLVMATASTGHDVDLETALRRAERRFERAVAAGSPGRPPRH